MIWSLFKKTTKVVTSVQSLSPPVTVHRHIRPIKELVYVKNPSKTLDYGDYVEPTGGMTASFYIDYDKKQVKVGLSVCSTKDNYNRKQGIEKSMQALQTEPIIIESVDFPSEKSLECILYEYMQSNFDALPRRLTRSNSFGVVYWHLYQKFNKEAQ